jgi:serine/threonine protein kinase/Tol biopolymer transport system component
MLDQDKNEQAIFQAAVRLTNPAEREAFVQQTCGDDPALLARLTSLLQAHSAEHAILDVLLPEHAVDIDGSCVSEGPGTVIGRYKLLEKIGEGGMAVVYMAEQTEPIRRKVALKIIKLGMDTRQVIARFEAERQALALMDHPSIAKVLDAGATETGRPYFVMELVQGVCITEYCDKNSLSTKDRLALFLHVCHAVQHAHQKGIIHRDIKPSNVMVTHHDGKPVPKVIDFGIAKATNQKLTEKTLFTRYAHIIGTPAYMSPEQADLSDLDIDTRSDIYSLGVLLYELLTGTTPFSEEELRKAGYTEMQRVIREQEPVRPSTKISTLGDTSIEIAKHRGSTPDLLRRAIRGDLDWIVMKSLEKDRTCRYETAGGLAEDIYRHLQHEPVLARAPSSTYRLRKFLRRHRLQLLAALVTAILAAVIVLILSLWNHNRLQLVEAESFKDRGILFQAGEQYAKAEREAALETLTPLLTSRHVGPEARLLQASILVDNRRSDEATTILKGLLHERAEVAGAAHALLARILWESASLDAEKLKEVEEHGRKAEALLPETAEAYFLRAMTAPTIKEQLAALDRALELDPKHYESRRLRAFTYYASRKYSRMRDEALWLTFLRPGDPLGHSLRAKALRELKEYGDALGEYDSALALTARDNPQYLDLVIQRSETLLRMGRHERVIVAAQEALGLWPNSPILRYYIFCARTALGDYHEANAVFQEIVRSAPTARNEFWFWATKYVFDTLEAGRSWHPPGAEPAGAAFLPLVEAEETYRELSAKGHRLVTDAFTGHWSPDGKKLAISLGVPGYNGVAIYDPATKETDLLIAPGKDPKWSPDGRHIAFVRDRRALRLEELTAAERNDQTRWARDEEVWFMKSDGTEPRYLVRGSWPSWSRDSTHIYFYSPPDSALCSISILGSDRRPERMITEPLLYPSVSPDNQRAAYLSQDLACLKVKDLSSQASLAEWRLPFDIWSPPAWSPTGKELGLSAGSSVGDRTGLWIYSLDGNEPVKVLSSQTMSASWAPDGTKLLFGLRPPYFELWAADLDPAISTVEALGPGQTLDQHWRNMLRLYTRRIETDPQDAYAYSDRARYYEYLHERTRADADMGRWSALMGGRSPLDLLFGPGRDLRRVIKMPFHYELVFSAERPVNTIPMMSVAFGQKGRCEMRLFEIPITVMSLLGLCFLSGLDGPPAHADFVFGEPINLGPPVNSAYRDMTPVLSPDGLELYFTSDRPGGYGGVDIWVTRRASLQDPWGLPTNLGPQINSSTFDNPGSMSADGLTLYLASGWDFYTTTRATKDAPWGPRVRLGPVVVPSTSYRNTTPLVTADGLELFFLSERPGGYGGNDIWVSTRATTADPWQTPVNLGPTVNGPANDVPTWLSPDGLTLLLCSDRPGGFGGLDMWITTRASRGNPWGSPRNLGPSINTIYSDWIGAISPDGWCYMDDFLGPRPGGLGQEDLWQAFIIPVVDFNGDGQVDLVDLVMLIDNWGTNQTLYDIGPTPWGDGKVDIEDLKVFMTYYEKENPPAQP